MGRARLSGTLIGAELAATRGWWLGTEVVIVGGRAQAAAYRAALAPQGVAAGVEDAGEMTLLGLAAAHGTLRETA